MVTYSMVISIIMVINRYSIWFTLGSHWFIWLTLVLVIAEIIKNKIKIEFGFL